MTDVSPSRRGSTNNLAQSPHPSRPQTVNIALPPVNSTTEAPIASGLANSVRVFENTYRVAPDKKFPSEIVRRFALEILEKRLSKVAYSADKAAEISKSITADIVQALKGLQLERYKFVTDVSICEFKGQGIRISSRALWDPKTDSFASATYKNASLVCVVLVFGVYFE